MALTVSEIHAVADQLDAAGTTPTLAAVRKALGGGSFTTISEAMQLWKAQRQAVAAPLREPAPAAFTERLGEIAADLWAIALELANSRLRAEREALEQARIELEQARQEAADLADQVSAELEQAHISLAQLAERHVGAEATAAQLGQELNGARFHVQSQQIALDAAAREAAELRAQVKEARAEAKTAIEAAAELKGRLGALEEMRDESRAGKRGVKG